MQITLRQKLYAGAVIAGVILAVATVDSIRSRIEIGRLERGAVAQKTRAEKSEQAAAAARNSADENSARAEYLEQQLQQIRAAAIKQDEKLQKLELDTNTARGRVGRARRQRSVESGTAELCEKLANLGHPCSE